MPGMSGWEVAEEIKKIDQKIPVILITGWEVLYKEKEIKKSGIDLVVNKPFQIDQILRIVKEGIQIGERTEGSNCDS
jgi:CheY-like chemotaxis protein